MVRKVLERTNSCKLSLLTQKIFIPIFASRNDMSGMMNFEIIYPEMQYKKMFEDGIDARDMVAQNSKVEFILLEKTKAFVIFKDNGATYKLIYGLKGYEQTEKLRRFD